MRKIYTLALLVAGAISLHAQQPGLSPGPTTQPAARTVKYDRSLAPTNRNTNPNVNPQAYSGWISYAESKDNDWGGGVSELNANYLFPDSTVLGEFGAGNWSSVWIHSLGDVFDVASPSFPNFYAGYNLTRSDAYSIDSMAIVYLYDRQHPNANIVDTLVIYLYSNQSSGNLYNNGFIGTTAANYGTDTVTFKGMHYNGAVNKPSTSASSYIAPSGQQVIKIPLTIADTSLAFFGVKAFSTNNFQVPAGKLAAVGINFIPGYTYNTGDTLDRMNAFFFGSMEEGGGGANGGSFPIYYDCNYQNTSCDYNCSFIIRTNERYTLAGNSWNGSYIPKYAFTQPYSLENHYLYYYISNPPASVEELAQSGLSLGQNVPNPANGNTIIKYSIADAGNVALTVYDVTGKQVMNFNQGRQVAGNYQVEINTNALQAGVYFYTLTVDGKQATRRMVVAE